MTSAPLGLPGIIRLGLVQSALGAMTMLATSLLNRVMVVEYALPAALPAGLVAWHYAVQLARPIWGHGSDRGRRRTPWIVGGLGVLAAGIMLAVGATALFASRPSTALLVAVLAFAMIGAGVGAAGTSLLALLASRVAPQRRAAAASITWIMMVAGIVVSAGVAGSLLDPFSPRRLALVVGGVTASALLLGCGALWQIEGAPPRRDHRPAAMPTRSPNFLTAVREMWADGAARRFTVFVFVSMLAYSMQDMILEPFAGLAFGYTPGQSTQLSGAQHGGVLAGMMLVGFGRAGFDARNAAARRRWIVAGCVGSALALIGLGAAATIGRGWPLAGNVVLLGFSNGVFAVAAIAAMMAHAGDGGDGSVGIRMGVWGAAQAMAFGLGGLIGAMGVDAGRAFIGSTAGAFRLVFGAEAGLFLVAIWLVQRAGQRAAWRVAPAGSVLA